MLRDAFFSLLQEKSFEAISIQDIAERSTVNRATFYDHYSDKPAVVEAVIVERFDGLLCQRQVCFLTGTCIRDPAAHSGDVRFSGTAQPGTVHKA